MYGYVYLTTNNVNGRMYVGQHKASKYDPSYYGSGKVLLQALEKYGKDAFSNKVLCWCDSKDELNDKEKEYIKQYLDDNARSMYNLAMGGNGGDVYYNDPVGKRAFVQKMTAINKERCSKDSFRQAISKATSARFRDKEQRDRQRDVVKKAWADPVLRKKQSERLKGRSRDCSFNKIKCCLELNGEKIVFDSVKALRAYMTTALHFTPDNRVFSKLLNSGQPYIPYHKNRQKAVMGLRIYKMNDDVETNRDECSGVGPEISTGSKDEAL